MKRLVKAICIIMLFLTMVSAVPRPGETVLPGHDFSLYNYETGKKWNLAQHHDGNSVVALITGSIC